MPRFRALPLLLLLAGAAALAAAQDGDEVYDKREEQPKATAPAGGDPMFLDPKEAEWYNKALGEQTHTFGALPANERRFHDAAGVVREEYRAFHGDGAAGKADTVVLQWPNPSRRSQVEAWTAIDGVGLAKAESARYTQAAGNEILIVAASGRHYRFRFAGERMLVRVDTKGFYALRVDKLAQRDGLTPKTAVGAALLTAREVLDSYDTARVAQLSGVPAGSDPTVPLLGYATPDEVKKAFWPAVNSVMQDLKVVALGLQRRGGDLPAGAADGLEAARREYLAIKGETYWCIHVRCGCTAQACGTAALEKANPGQSTQVLEDGKRVALPACCTNERCDKPSACPLAAPQKRVPVVEGGAAAATGTATGGAAANPWHDAALTVASMTVALGETFQRMSAWAKRAHELVNSDEALARAMKDAQLDREEMAAVVREAERLIKADKRRHPASGVKADDRVAEEKYSMAIGKKLGLGEALSAHLLDTHQDRRHRMMALEHAEEKVLRDKLTGAGNTVFNKLDAELEALEKDAHTRAVGDSPEMRLYTSDEQRALQYTRSMLPKLHEQVNEFLWTRVVESRIVKEALGDINGLVVWGEDEAVHWSKDVSLWVHDVAHMSEHSGAAQAQVHEEAKHLGEKPLATSAHEAARDGKEKSLLQRGEKLFAAGERLGAEAMSESGVSRQDHEQVGGWRVDRAYRVLPTVTMAKGVLQSLAYQDHVHLSNGKGLHHDVGLEIKVSDPFLKSVNTEATGRWLTSKGNWHAGGSVHMVVAGFRDVGTHVRSVDVTGFAGYDDGTTKTGVFVSLERQFEQDAAGQHLAGGQPVTTVHPYFTHKLTDNGRVGFSAEFKRTPTVQFEESFKASYTHRFANDLYFQGMLRHEDRRDPLGLAGTHTKQTELQGALLREFGTKNSGGLRSSVRVWGGAYQDHLTPGGSKPKAAFGLEVIVRF